MNVIDMVADARDAVTVQKVFGEPIHEDGMIIIPVARIASGGGAGSGESGPGQNGQSGAGSGGGFGLRGVPAGLFTIHNGEVRWQPAVDVNRAILGGQVVAVAALLVLRSYLKIRARRVRRT